MVTYKETVFNLDMGDVHWNIDWQPIGIYV
jgi:hypothetical protein